ncbi:hypothetical protein DSO57_1022098 [Entomophthora muscae]|uniref:Uncharacterized protein n=2 Tax=Entomophthora muscae TaxID=34485 RepID=A0ACC2T450_9FUNG|nr:hypothetical protein DSO57_1008355 [Entomophthora muscae]KAJ9069077.1 hypothetical protein DSO57_1022098 [Entomophthora muscae]
MKFFNVLINVGIVTAQCSNPRVRKEIRELSEKELHDFQDAVNKLHKERKEGMPELSSYEYFSYLHNTNAHEAHFTPAFMPWHRYFIRKFEMELQRFNPNVMLPYWDWSLDANEPHRSPILTDKYMGGNGGAGRCVRDGPFAYWTVGYPENHCLKRDYDQGRRLSPFSSPESILLDINTRSFSAFSMQFEIKHGRPHTNIGGNGVDFSQMHSPNDPLFYLHHAFVDLIWDKWQQRHPDSLYEGSRFGVEVDVTDQLAGFDDVAIKDTFDMDDEFYCYQYPQYPRLIKGGKVPSRLNSLANSVFEANPFSAGELQHVDMDSALRRLPNLTQTTKMLAASSHEDFGQFSLLNHPSNLTDEFIQKNNINPMEVTLAQAKDRDLTNKLNALDGFRSISSIQAVLNNFF